MTASNTLTAAYLANSLVEHGIFQSQPDALTEVCRLLGQKKLPPGAKSNQIDSALQEIHDELLPE